MKLNNPFKIGAWAGISSIIADLNWVTLDMLGLDSVLLKLILVIGPLLLALILVLIAIKVYGDRGPK